MAQGDNGLGRGAFCGQLDPGDCTGELGATSSSPPPGPWKRRTSCSSRPPLPAKNLLTRRVALAVARKAAEASLHTTHPSRPPAHQAGAMDKFRMLFQHFQSTSESVMNGICLLLAAVTVKLYSSFDFNCPCLARYNALYGLGLLLTPPLALFLCGLLANRQSVVMVEEWRRPAGHRRKDPGIIRCAPRDPWALPGAPQILTLPCGHCQGHPHQCRHCQKHPKQGSPTHSPHRHRWVTSKPQ